MAAMICPGCEKQIGDLTIEHPTIIGELGHSECGYVGPYYYPSESEAKAFFGVLNGG